MRRTIGNRLSANRRQYLLREASLNELAQLAQEAGEYDDQDNPLVKGVQVTEIVEDDLVEKDEDG